MKRPVAVIGSGPAALMLAAWLDETKFDVTLYERNYAPARKFLVAGDGGFNLSHSENTDRFIFRYTPSAFFQPLISAFSNDDLRGWLKTIGIETYTGTSGRIFPLKGIRPIAVLNAILQELKRKNVRICTQHTWKGWDGTSLLIENREEEIAIRPGITVFALGGGSWSRTGSDGSWVKPFEEKGIRVVPLQASNCAYKIDWPADFLSVAEGASLKNISITCADQSKSGEAVITRFGIEGGAVYALSPQIRQQLQQQGRAEIHVDLKPVFSAAETESRLSARGNRSHTRQLEDALHFNAVHIALLKAVLTKEEFTDPVRLSQKIKHLPLTVTAAAPIEESISTAGGISLDEITEQFELKKLPGNFVIGEMLDWDAPTGGYLLQACFSMGYALAGYLNKKEP